MKRKILSIVLVVVLALSMLQVSALAAYTDVQDHWAQAAIDKWSGLGIIQGNEGKFRPNAPITRGELAVIIDNIMDYQTEAQNTFTDLDQNYYTSAVLKANAAGVMSGFEGKIRPAANISREEATVMLARALGLTESTTAANFTDLSSVSTWARGLVNAMANKGFVSGFDGKFNPQAMISRAEIVTILNNAIAQICSEAKEYTGDVTGTVVVNKAGVVLKDMTITGDLIIAQGVGSGDVTLNNVKVTGNTFVRGGGANSIHINGTSDLTNLIIEKTDDGQIRVVTADGATVDAVFVDDGNDDVILTGTFGDITINAGLTVNAIGATIGNATINADGAKLLLDSASSIGTLTVNAPSEITNNGTITKAVINADGVTITGNEPLDIEYSEGVLGASDTDDGGPGGGIVTPPTIAVTSVSVDVTELTLVVGGDTGTIAATVSPANATDKTVTWTSSDESIATVTGGIVTPVDGGIVTITATAGSKSATVTVSVGDAIVSNEQSIQAAIDAADPGDTILVTAGTYKERLNITKALTLLGPNMDHAGTAARSAEARITYPDALTNDYYELVCIEADDVTIAGFTLDDGGQSSADVETTGVYFHGNNVTVKNNILDGFNYIQIWASSYEYTTKWEYNHYKNNALVEGNYCMNALDFFGIYMQGTSGIVRGNTISNAPAAIQIQPYGNPTGGVVDNNNVSAFILGIWYNYAEKGSGSWTIQNNTVSAAAVPSPLPSYVAAPTYWAGLRVQTFGTSGSGTAPSVTFAGNTVNGPGSGTSVYGIWMMNNIATTATAAFTGNTISNVQFGAFRESGSLNLDTVLAGNTFAAGSAAIGNKIFVPASETVYNKNTGETYTTINAAITDANAGDTIYVGNDEFIENLAIGKAITLQSLNGPEVTEIVGTITITADNVTIDGFKVTAPTGYTAAPVIHMIGVDGISIINNTVVAEGYGAIGTSTGPAKVTGTISGNTVTGMIIVGTDGALTVSNNTVTANAASAEGICFYPVGASANLTITGNTVSGVSGGNKDIKVNERPASINGITDDSAMEANIKGANSDATVSLSWVKTINNDAELAAAIASQANGQTWIINSGTYNISRTHVVGTPGGDGTIGTYLHISANNLKIIGIGTPTLTTDEKGTGNWQDQQLVVVKGNNVTIEGINFIGNISEYNSSSAFVSVVNKIVEIYGNNFTLRNATVTARTDYDGGTIYYSCGAGKTSVLENVILDKGRISFSGATGLDITLKDVEINFTGHSKEDQGYKPIYLLTNTATVVAENVVARVGLNSTAYLQDTLNNLPSGATLELAAGTYELPSQLNVTKPVTLTGVGDVTVKAVPTVDWAIDNSNKHLVLFTAGTSSNPITVNNITFDADGKSCGLNTYNSAYVVLNDVTVIGSRQAGLIVNGSTVVAHNLTISGSVWGSVNVDPGFGVTTPSEFTLTGNGTLAGPAQIWSDGANVDETATVTVNAEGYTETVTGDLHVWSSNDI